MTTIQAPVSKKISGLMADFISARNEAAHADEAYEALRNKLVETFAKESIEKVADPVLGSFTIARKTTYEYSEATQKIAERLKIAKVREEEKGIAKVKSETSFLKYTEPMSS